MAGTDLQGKAQGSLADQIAEIGRRLQNRQRLIGLRRSLLNQHIRQKIASPVTLLVAGSVGFVIGDLTRGERKKGSLGEEVPRTSPRMEVIDNVVGWVRPIFLAEMGKIMQSFSSVVSNELSEQIYRLSEKAFTEKADNTSEPT